MAVSHTKVASIKVPNPTWIPNNAYLNGALRLASSFLFRSQVHPLRFAATSVLCMVVCTAIFKCIKQLLGKGAVRARGMVYHAMEDGWCDRSPLSDRSIRPTGALRSTWSEGVQHVLAKRPRTSKQAGQCLTRSSHTCPE